MSEALPRYTDVSLTDSQSARWAGAMTTPMMLAVASRLAATVPAAIEIASAATLQQCLARGELLGQQLPAGQQAASWPGMRTPRGCRRSSIPTCWTSWKRIPMSNRVP